MIKKTTTLFTLLVLAYTAVSQTYPVNVSTTLTPPYSVFLADYVAPGSDRLAVNIFLGDVNRPELQVKLRLRIEGQGIIIETKPEYLPPPLILQGGIPQRLIASELADYLAPQNLNFQGITRQQFERTGALPEGLYKFCFEVLEYNRGVKISNTGCTMAWMILNDPPLINLPRQNEKIRPQDPQFVTFQWTPRHTGSPNSAFRTEYEFSMVELWPATRNPNDAIFTMPPIHQVTTQSTTLIYGPAETPLVAGRSYAFRVKAKSIVGVDELDLFKNNGYSETVMFTYGDACTLPQNISAEAVNAGKFKVSWTPNYNHSAFSVRYRLYNVADAEWYEEDSFFDDIEVDGLQPETTYEYQVSGSCGAFTSDFSDVKRISTPALPEVNFTCGLPPENFQLDNTTPVEGLKVGDVIQAGDFDVKVVELTPNGNRFSGKGNVVVPYLDNLLVSVNFLNIGVNTDYRLFAGAMDIIGIGLDIIPPELSELLDKLDEGLATLDDLLGEISEGLDIADEILDAAGELANEIMDNGPFSDDEERAQETYTVEDFNREAKEALADAVGGMANAQATNDFKEMATNLAKAMAFKKRGNKLKNIYATADTLNVIAVEFYENSTYGFDIKQYSQHRLHYNIMVTDSTDATTNTAIPWAAVKENETITVKARLIPDKGISAADIIFKTANGDELTASRNGNEWSVQLPPMTNDQLLIINAINTTTNETVGKLQAKGYAPISKKVILVSVNGMAAPSATEVATYLNTVYKQAVADWTVELGTALQVEGFDGTLQDDEQATLSTYSTGMKEIIRAFTKDTTTIDKDAFYLFMVDKSSTGNAGYMPRKHRYGFIYTGEQTPEALPRTIAHELGHGAFRLQHTWEEYPNIAKRSSQNLMDYGTGTQLRKYQWDLIHNPPLVIGLVEDMSEGALAGRKWFTPDWKVFKVASSKTITYKPANFMQGTISGFIVDEAKYYAEFDKEGKFLGYFSSDNNAYTEIEYYPDIKSSDSVYVYQYDGGCKKDKFYKTTYGNAIDNKESPTFFYDLGEGKIIDCTLNIDLEKLCEDGRTFYDTYESTLDNNQKESLFKVASLICEKGEDYYNALLSQIDKLNTDKLNSFVWDSEPILFQKVLDYYWERPDAWERYANALITINSAFEENSNLEKANSSDLFFLMEYCSIELLNQLSAEEKVRILQIILKQELVITDGNLLGLFFNGINNEEGLIVKLIASVKADQSKEFLKKLQNFTDGDKNIYTALMAKVDDAGGVDYFTAINQMLFVKLIESEGGLDKYIEKYKDLEVDFLWHQRENFWIIVQENLVYNEKINDNGTIEVSADFEIEFNSIFGNGRKEVDCQTEDCSDVFSIAFENVDVQNFIYNEINYYRFSNFIPPTTLKPYDVVLIKFRTGINGLGIEKGTYMPLPAFFFYAILENNDWDMLKRDVENLTTVGTSLFAGRALVNSTKLIVKAFSGATLFFNATNEFILNPEVESWLRSSDTGKIFLKGYRVMNLISDLAGFYKPSSKALIFNFMSSYFSAEAAYDEVFRKEFEDKFKTEYDKMVEEMNKLK